MWGLGKPRSKLGKYIASMGISVSELSKESKVNRNTLGKACADQDYIPSGNSIQKIIRALRKIDPSISANKFWDI
jgi:predicted transcriptional regulator